MPPNALSLFPYIAALVEIAGWFAFWEWRRLGKPLWWLAAGTTALTQFAWLLMRVESDHAGRAFAA